MQAMQPALRQYLTKLREDAYIDIKPGFVDTGASPNETKPVFSAYAPPQPKKKKEKERFDRHGRFSTASKTTPAPAATPAVATTTTANTTAANTSATKDKNLVATKPKKIKREKIRFGQAPRTALPPGPEETAVGAGAGEAASTQTADAGAAVAPGAAMTMENNSAQVLPADADPLAPKTTPDHKTRYSDRAKTEKADKAAKKKAAIQQKAAYTPLPESTQEQADRRQQSAPLGLNGDTATKKKKKRAKGEPKERLQNKPTTPPPPPAPTVNPSLGATPEGMTPAPPPAAPAQQPAPSSPPSNP